MQASHAPSTGPSVSCTHMLVLSRKVGEAIRVGIGEGTEIVVLSITGRDVKLGISSSSERVCRLEVFPDRLTVNVRKLDRTK